MKLMIIIIIMIINEVMINYNDNEMIIDYYY